ncbi:gliding motility-associated C-terminal domain-containing protein [Flavobacterium sp. WC2509]|uniref:gliding motility-associated C-terminal domain-containing protein n=1 Tax=Flavobacterium sp. WC2509 TaxID=3461406 RepID=UPI004044655D
MVRKLLFSFKFTFPTYLILIYIFVFSIDINAQCAGNNGTLTDVCDITNPNSKVINLFSGLGGSPITGGTWKDDNKSGGLDKVTGILNAQQIKKSGIYHYTYTVTGASGCPINTAIVTVTIGGYTGVPGPNASICNTKSAYNLYEAFNGDYLEPQNGGTWVGNTSNLGLNGNMLDATKLNYDTTYQYTYSIPAIGSCVAPPDAKIFVTIFRSPLAGTPKNLRVCSNDLSTYTNLDLNDRLTGEDTGGVWTEVATDEIDDNDDSDSTINVQNIYNTKGSGTYTFTYTVLTDNNVCEDQTTSVDITIDKIIDFTGITLDVNSDICEDAIPTATYTAVIKGDPLAIANGLYDISYTVTGTTGTINTTSSFSNGILNFAIPSLYFQQAQDYIISIKNIMPVGSQSVCVNILATVDDVLHITSIPKINNATLTIAPVCQSSDVIVNFSGTSNLTNGNYNILYNLSGSNTQTAIPYVLNIIGGVGTITIPKSLVPNVGQTTILITDIKNSNNNCPNKSTLSQIFTINPLPDITNLNVIIKNICKGDPATIELSGLGTLSTIEISYSLLGANSVNLKTIPLTVVAGNVNFNIPASDLPNAGITTFSMSSIRNLVNGCPLSMNKNVNFTVNSLPDTSTLTSIVKDGCPNLPLNVDVAGLGTLSNVTFNYTILSGSNTINLQTDPLVVTGGKTNFIIPASVFSVPATYTLLISNITNLTTGCSTVISTNSQNFVIVPIPNNPIANNQEFCKEDLATVANLKPSGTQYKWYDSSSSTTALLPNILLTSKNYYLKEVNLTGCESNATSISVLINSVPIPTLNSNGQNFCGADKPTIQNLSNNTIYLGNLSWYNTPTIGTVLVSTDLLIEGNTYYGFDYNTTTKCISAPLEATVSLTSCNVTPEDLKIPDGFSPNGDGVNDTFKIIDIEFLFPNFTLEIFNRYGNILFKGNISKPDWDGKNSNSNFINGDSPTGVYFYIINYNKDDISPKQGQLYLNR